MLTKIPQNNIYYMPHHGIQQSSNNKRKLRVVFDASAKTTSGLSLNSILMVGPKIQNDIFSVLCRFRSYRFVLSADIIKMYRQILIHPEDATNQLILWQKEHSGAIQTFKLKTVTYGTACAPFLAMRCLRQLSQDYQDEYPLGAKALKHDLYVDDILTGSNSLQELIVLRDQIINVLKRAGMELHKWCSNTDEVIENIHRDFRQEFISIDDNNTTQALGMSWHPTQDQFRFDFDKIKISNKISKRSVLSTIASLFDPMGLINPIIVEAKVFMQELWKKRLHWDESLPISLHSKWEKFIHQLKFVDEIKINRHTLQPQYSEVQLHGFADASQSAYGACVYLRSTDKSQKTSVNLLCAKSRVAPLRTISIARLELCA